MKLSTTISPDDYLDFLRFLDRPVSRKLKYDVANLAVVGAGGLLAFSIVGFVAILGFVIVRVDVAVLFATLLNDIRLLGVALLGVVLLPVAFWWFRVVRRWRPKMREEVNQSLLDESALRDGLDIGESEIEFSDGGVRVLFDLAEETYSWNAFRVLEETEKYFLLMITASSGVIIPKRATESDSSLQDLKSFIEARIGVKA